MEVDEAIDAEIYVNKASALINAAAFQSKSGEDAYGPVQLRFRVTYARVLDANRKFAEAAVRYYGLSTTTGYNVSHPAWGFSFDLKFCECILMPCFFSHVCSFVP